jgi:ribosomal protein S6--L-glutamate ligase
MRFNIHRQECLCSLWIVEITPMQFAVLGNAGSWYCDVLQGAATSRGHHCKRIDFTQLTSSVGVAAGAPQSGSPRAVPSESIKSSDVALNNLDAVIVRTMPPGSLEQVVFRMDALARLEAAGVTVMNSPKAIECAVDKYLATSRLAAAGLPVPETVVCENADAALAAFETLGGDVVVKPLFGAEGRGIVRVSDPDLALRTFRTLERIDAVLYLQRFVEHEGFDVRLLLLDGKLIGAMKRRSWDDFRTNVSRSGKAELHTATEAERDLALRAAAAVGTRFAGVDLLYDRSGACYVIEVNAVPGWRALQRVTGGNVASDVIASFEE